MPWFVTLGRAIPALALAVAITFSADHSARLGLLAFGLFAVVTAVVTTALAWRARRTLARSATLTAAAVSGIAGAAALAVPAGGTGFLVLVVSGWAILTGATEIVGGIRRPVGDPGRRDAIIAGSLTVLLAIAVLVVPPDLSQPYQVEGMAFALTAPVVIVGLLGAYAAILGVFLVIGALSQKWTPAPRVESAAPTPEPTS